MAQEGPGFASYHDFRQASTWLSGAPGAASLSNDVKLEACRLYGIFKFLTTKSGPSTSRPSIFTPAARAKHDAWVQQAKLYAQYGEQAAQSRYVQIAKGVGWAGEAVEDDDEEIDFDAPTPPEESAGKQKSAGMGSAVSAMARADGSEQEEAGERIPIFDAVLANDTDAINRILAEDPSAVKCSEHFGNTPLHIAADRGHLDAARCLIQHGAELDALDDDGQTPFMLAEVCGRTDIIALLGEGAP